VETKKGAEIDSSLRGFNSRLVWSVLGLLAIVIFGLLAAPGCTPPAPEVGRLAPDFTLSDLEGNSVTLSDFRGKVVFINFWTTRCPSCRAMMPVIEAIYQEYKGEDVVVISVNLFEAENVVRQYVQRGDYSWTFVIDTTGEVANNYSITTIPTSFFVDKEGIIRAVNVGAMTKRAMESRLAEAMK